MSSRHVRGSKRNCEWPLGWKRWDILEWTRSSVNVEERKTTRSWEGSLKGGGIWTRPLSLILSSGNGLPWDRSAVLVVWCNLGVTLRNFELLWLAAVDAAPSLSAVSRPSTSNLFPTNDPHCCKVDNHGQEVAEMFLSHTADFIRHLPVELFRSIRPV